MLFACLTVAINLIVQHIQEIVNDRSGNGSGNGNQQRSRSNSDSKFDKQSISALQQSDVDIFLYDTKHHCLPLTVHT